MWRWRILAILVGAGLLASLRPAFAEPLAGPVAARVERIVDGDTVRVRAQIWIDQEVEIAVRIDGADAPELFRPRCPAEKTKALEAKAFASAFFPDGEAVLRNVHYGKYAGRVIAQLENSAGNDLAEALVEAGLAARDGAKPWCPVS